MEEKNVQRVVVTDLDISFGNLVMLWFKIALAAIPAAVLLGIVGVVVVGVLGGLVRH